MREFADQGNPPDMNNLKAPYFLGLNKEKLIVIGALLFIPVFAFLINAEGITNYILIIVGVVCLGYLIITALMAEDKVEGQRLLVFIFLFFFHMIFWALFEQAGGSLNILTDGMSIGMA
jgi:proton-dependent oligopeptide transporter, POT family